MKSKYILLIFIALAVTSCESFLEENPPTFISTTNFYKTESDARTACDGVYKMLSDGSGNSIYGRWWPAIDLGTDDMVSKVGRTNFNDWFTHTINPEHNWIQVWGQYQGLWTGISRANDVIDNVPNIDMDEEIKNSIIGEASALRALYYFHLVKTWGDMPMITKSVTSADIFEQPRSNVNEIYNQVIIPDLKFAEENCVGGLHTGRITKWTAKMILADVYMTRAGWSRTSQGQIIQGDANNWQLAKDKAAEIILESPHVLNTEGLINGADTTPAYGVAWNSNAPFTSESILELAAINQNGFGSWLSRECGPWPTGTDYWGAGGNRPFENEGITTNVVQMRFSGNPAAVGLYIPTPDLWAAFEDGDERRDWSLMTRYRTPEGDNFVTQPTFRKYVDLDYYLGKENTSFLNTNNNFILYRLADALLIYAEAANEVAAATTGDAAYDAINQIRARAGLTPLAGLSQDDFRKAVAKERRCEFNAECKRRFDLIRTNQINTETMNIQTTWTTAEGAVNEYENRNTLYSGNVVWPDREWLMPIPQIEMELNADFGWQQNEGY